MGIPYQAVSMNVVLRDYIDPDYINTEHKDLCDLADTIYATGMTPVSNPEFYKPQYREVYNSQTKEWWDLVIADIRAIKSQLDSGNKSDLISDYTELINELR